MPILDIGDGSTAAPDLVQFGVGSAGSVTVACLAASASTANVFQAGIDAAATAVTAGNGLVISNVGPFWVQAAAGIATVQVTGGIYGAV